ncbi:MAG TPA: exodeoxyribonuclease VII small subunit [Bacteroidota bacterium]|nr:exodeoxyribonuclease VII small subunit [Bacteroidota bacterium]
MPRQKEQSFEEIMKRLETIVEQMERGDLPLDKSVQLYEEGIGLSKLCLEHLRKTEVKLKRLSKELDGSFTLTEEE